MQVELTGPQVQALMQQMPAGAQTLGSGVSYDGATLTIPDAFGDAAKAIMAKSGWDAPPAGPSLASVQTSLSADIDTQAEAQRLKYITPGEAQMATYLLKRGQALSALANQTADAAANKTADQLAAAYPYMANEIGITIDPTTKAPASDVYGVARAVSAIAAVWQGLDLAIERVRLATKMAISAAETASAVQAAHDAVAWPAPPAA